MAEVALWQYRWLNPGNYPDQPLSMLEWKNVEAWNPRMQTVEQRVEELRSFRYDGKPAYEVRALGVIPDGVPAAPAPDDDDNGTDEPTPAMREAHDRLREFIAARDRLNALPPHLRATLRSASGVGGNGYQTFPHEPPMKDSP